MSTVDIVILCLVALPTVVGVFYGFLNILFSLLSWAVSLGLSVKLVPYFSPLLENYVNTPILRDALAFIALFILSLLVMTGISYFLVKLLGSAGLTAADRILGLLFGMGLGGLIVTVIIFMAGFTALPQEVWWEESKLASPFERISIWSSRFLPESINANLSYVQANEDN
ncbi:CvpA family protein [Gammaproteobacteria bacterium]|jgi:membrane protein required for colicin V production|nr:CvpA family protein [Gammaproteobacteria bacterium]